VIGFVVAAGDMPMWKGTMELIDAVAALWRRKVLLLVGFVLAVAAGLLTTFTISTSYPFLHKRAGTTYGVAVSQMLVDFRHSTLADATQDDTALIDRAAAFPSVLADPAVMRNIIRLGQLGPDASLTVTGPFVINEPRAQTEAPAIERAFQVSSESVPYSLEVSSSQGSTIIDVYAQGPTAAGAFRLGEAVPVALDAFLKHSLPSSHIDPTRLITVRSLGPPVAKTIGSSGTRKLIGIGAAVGTFLIWCLVVLGVRHLAEASRMRSVATAREDWEFEPDAAPRSQAPDFGHHEEISRVWRHAPSRRP